MRRDADPDREHYDRSNAEQNPGDAPLPRSPRRPSEWLALEARYLPEQWHRSNPAIRFVRTPG
jgi:hypothetical protein